MSEARLTPRPHLVFNELDKHGLLLGLQRLERERNPEYRNRLNDVFVNRADSTYRGLVNGITRELGLSIIDLMTVKPEVDSDGITLLPEPAVIFDETKVYLYSDFTNGDLIDTLDRFDNTGEFHDIESVVNAIIGTGYWSIELEPNVDTGKRSMTIFNQSSIKEVGREDISGKGSRIVLQGTNLLEGTFIVRSSNLTRKRDSEVQLREPGDYYVDNTSGTLFTVGNPAPGSFVRYRYRDDNFLVQSSPVIIHNLQSTDFQTKMFEQITGDDGTTSNGRPTNLGADIINELLSVHPSNWGT